MVASDGAPVHLLTLTTLFPNARQPRHGIFIATRLARMRDTGRVDPSVIAAVPWFPGVPREAGRAPREEIVRGLRVRHPRYLNVPAIGMRVQPASLARALLAEVRRGGAHRNADVVDAHYFYPDGVAAAVVAQALGLPLVISARGSDINLIGEIPVARRRRLAAAARADALIAVSEALAQRMRALGMPSDRIHVLRNGVDGDVFFPVPRADARRRMGLGAGERWVLGVGNLVPEKGFDLLIRAMSNVERARLLLVGEGPLRRALGAIAEEQAPGRVVFHGNMPQDALRDAYSACDVLALPSLREGWPNVVLEALACGTPVAASPVGGVTEMLEARAPARLVPERDPAAWGTALSALLDAAPSRDTVRAYALRFGWDEIVAAQCALYERIARGHRQHECARAR